MRNYWGGLAFFIAFAALGQTQDQGKTAGDRTREGGPEVGNLSKRSAITAQEVLKEMFSSVEKTWILPAYSEFGYMELDANLAGALPGKTAGNSDSGTLSIEADIDGKVSPNGQYAMAVRGEFGSLDLVNNLQRRLVTSHSFKSFSDRPVPSRNPNANLTNFRSYFLRYLGQLREGMLESGSFRSVYVGSGVHDGYEVDVVRVYRPPGKVAQDRKAPISMKRLWTFWQDGAYELWVHKNTRLPAVIFYTNVDDQIYANFRFQYDRNWLPERISYNNNSVGSEGKGDLILDFGEDRLLRGASLNFVGNNGLSIQLDATLFFKSEPVGDVFRILPPFGFRKVNHDHLKILILTQISGSLLKLKKHGINIRNFKF